MSEFEHIPVLLQASMDALNIRPSGIYIDGTFGRGGHSREILKRLNADGRLLVFDKDIAAITAANRQYADDPRVEVIHGSFARMYKICEQKQVLGRVNGVLLDLGVSSPQLDDASRGFSFMRSGYLDMRMDQQQGESAAQWLQRVDEKTLARVLREYGEERYHRRIAAAIVKQRQSQPITDTLELAEIIKRAHPRWERHKHPATRSFQAIRIAVNRELEDLQQVLLQIPQILVSQGRLVVISFHSLEDRMVKQCIQKLARGDDFPLDLPLMEHQLNKKMKKIGKAIRASAAEVGANPRARSAVLRVAEKIA